MSHEPLLEQNVSSDCIVSASQRSRVFGAKFCFKMGESTMHSMLQRYTNRIEGDGRLDEVAGACACMLSGFMRIAPHDGR